MTDADPRMLPGVSARGLWRAVYAILFGAVALCLLVLPVDFIVHASRNWTPTFGVATLAFVVAVAFLAAVTLPILVPVARKTQRRELAAGYTTLMPEFDQVDGINPTTARVVRPARIVANAVVQSDQITTGESLGVFETGRTPLHIAFRRRIAVSCEVASITVLLGCLTVFVSVAHPSGAREGIALLVAISALIVAITIPVVVLAFAPTWYYTARLRTGEATQVYATTPSNPDIVDELAGAETPPLPSSQFRAKSFLVLNATHMTLYSRFGTTLVPYLDVPRTRIIDARVGRSAFGTGGSSVPSPVLTFRKDSGSELMVTFSLIGPNYRSSRRRFERDSRDIVDWAQGTPTPTGAADERP